MTGDHREGASMTKVTSWQTSFGGLRPRIPVPAARGLLFVSLVAVGLAAVAAVGPALAVAEEQDTFWLPLSAVEAGMRGYGLTVFHGSRVDTFGVQVLGVQRKVRAKGNLILVELSSPELELAAIPQGMSGSPVFLEGRFAGAVAFGWAGALRPIVGLTPAEEMLALPTGATSAEIGRRGLTAGVPPSLKSLLAVDSSGQELAADLFDLAAGPASASVTAAAIACDPSWPEPGELAAELLGRWLTPDQQEGYTWQPLPTGFLYQPLSSGESAGRVPASSGSGVSPLVPGSACAVPLVMGDVQLGALGTTTWVTENRVLLMGHPFMQRGPVTLPLATADILTIFPSRQMSFKIGSIGPMVGVVHHDLRAGLAGRLGPAPDLLPVTVTVNRTGGHEQYVFEVVKDPQLTPALVFWSLYNGLLVRGDDLSQQTIHYDIQTFWRWGDVGSEEPIRLKGAVAGPGGALSLGPEWMAPLQILMANRHEAMDLVRVNATLTVTRPMSMATIASLHAPDRALAGETIGVTVTIQPRRGEPLQEKWQLTIPSHLPAGSYRLLAANARDLFALEAERAAARFDDPSLPATLELIRTPRSATELVIALFVPSRGVVVDGRELSMLPPSVALLLQGDSTGRVNPTRAGIAMSERRDSEYVLQGHIIRKLRIHSQTEPIREDTRP